MMPSPYPAPWLSVAQIISTGVDFGLDFLYIWLVAFIWYMNFINLVFDFVLNSICNLDWFGLLLGLESGFGLELFFDLIRICGRFLLSFFLPHATIIVRSVRHK